MIIHGVDTEKLNARAERITSQIRRRAIMLSRLWYGFTRLFHQPLTLVFPFLLFAAAIAAWGFRDAIPLPGGGEVFPELVKLWHLTLSALIVVAVILALWGILVWLGTPRHVKKIELSLEHIGLVDRYNFGPALLHIHPIKDTAVNRMEFYSKGISMEVWEEREQDICDALNVHFVEPPCYGGRKSNNRNYICITVASGAESRQTEALYDEF